ncbi:MAG TPA: hypothetical protein VF756_09750 [Thermoanaerobaculia bacterium]
MNRAIRAAVRCSVVAGLGLTALLSTPEVYAGTSTQSSPAVVFNSPGQKSVTLQVCNLAAQCTSITRTVTVLDPMPVISSATVVTPVVESGQLVILSGSGSGKPPLTYTWQISLGGSPVLSLSGATAYWNTAGFPAGAYTARLSLQNTAGSAQSLLLPIAVTAERPSDFYTVAPCRAYDSRSSVAVASGTARTISVGGFCGIPLIARAVAANVTVVNATAPGFAALYPGNYPVPSTSTINFVPGATRANSAILPLATDGTGSLSIFVSIGGAGSAHVIVDVSGYFLPEAVP